MSNPKYQPLRALPFKQQIKFLLFTALLMLSLVGLLASISIALMFTSKPEMERWMPEGIMCGTCGEIESAEVRRRVGCRRIDREGGGKAVFAKGNVEYGMLEKCWIVDEGMDT